MRVWQPPGCPQGVSEGLKQMRGSWVLLSPDSPGSDAMKTRTEPGNPGARKIYPNCLQLFTSDCLGETQAV